LKQKKKEQNSEQTIFVAWQQGDFFFFFCGWGRYFFLSTWHTVQCCALISIRKQNTSKSSL